MSLWVYRELRAEWKSWNSDFASNEQSENSMYENIYKNMDWTTYKSIGKNNAPALAWVEPRI